MNLRAIIKWLPWTLAVVHSPGPGCCRLTPVAMKTGSRRLAGLAVLLASVCAVSCRPPLDRIGDILARPSEFSDRAVVVEGRVTKAVQLPFVNQHVYFLNDGSGEIAVVTTRDVPQRDATV